MLFRSFLADTYSMDGTLKMSSRVARMRDQMGGRSAEELCNDSITAMRKGSYLDAWELADLCMQAAHVHQLTTMTPDQFLDLWRNDPDTIWGQYFADPNGVGWVYYCLHRLVEYAPTEAWALRAHQQWEACEFIRVIHPVYHARAQAVKKPWLSTYVNYRSRTMVSYLQVNLACGGPYGEAVRMFRELQKNEENFPNVLPQTGAIPFDARVRMRVTVHTELARIGCRPKTFMHPTGCFSASFILSRVDAKLPASAFNAANWRSEWGNRADVIGNLTDAIAESHHGRWSNAMRHLSQFIAQAPDNLLRDVVVGEICWKMVGFSQTVLQAVELLEIIAEKQMSFVRPIY